MYWKVGSYTPPNSDQEVLFYEYFCIENDPSCLTARLNIRLLGAKSEESFLSFYNNVVNQ